MCIFEAPFSGLEATYAVHLRLVRKVVVNFLLHCITELFWLGTTVNEDGKSILHISPGLHWGTSVSHTPIMPLLLNF